MGEFYMFIIKRNQVVITALVIMIAIAGYLSYIDRDDATASSILLTEDIGIDGLNVDTETLAVNNVLEDGTFGDSISFDENTEISSEYVSDQNSSSGEAIFVNNINDPINTSYFIQAKLDREQSRAKQKELLTEMINNTNTDSDKKAESAERILELQSRIEKENAAETMIESKGFTEAYVRIDDETVDVVISKEALTDSEIAQIEDIVKRKTGMNSDKIRISPMKK
jgi:stage III sporulation protein AH